MKKFIYPLFFTIIPCAFHAQITLTFEANTPSPGDAFRYVYSTGLPPGYSLDSAGQTWDFSSLTGDTAVFNFILPDSAMDTTSFPGASMVETNSSAENYFYKDTAASEIIMEGHYIPGALRCVYTDKREYLKFPVTWNDTFNETFAGQAENLSVGMTFDRSGSILIKADGYGALILPYGTVDNVLRIIMVYNYEDEYDSSTYYTYQDTVYTWFNTKTSYFIASVSVGYVDGIKWTSQASYIVEDDYVETIKSISDNTSGISLYPNPASEYINIRGAEKISSTSIYNISGMLLLKKKLYYEPVQRIDISDLQAGIYFVTFSTENGIYSEKLVVGQE